MIPEDAVRTQLERQVSHWEAAIEALGRPDDFAAPEAWRAVERYLGQAVRSSLHRSTERLRGEVPAERHGAVEQSRFREPPQDEVGVGHRRLRPAEAVAGRTGLGARADRADLHQAVAVEPGDRAAAGADRVDVDHGEADREARHLALEGDFGGAAVDQRDVGGGAAHVERDESLAQRRGAQDAAGRPGDRAGRQAGSPSRASSGFTR